MDKKATKKKAVRKTQPRKSRSPRTGATTKEGDQEVRYFPSKRFTPALKKQVLHILSRRFFIGEACHAAGISYETFRTHRKKDPEFAAAVAEAEERYKALVGGTLSDRAIDGWDEPVFGATSETIREPDGTVTRRSGHGVVGHVRKYDNKLLLELARKVDPTFRARLEVDQRTEHSGFVVGDASLSDLSAEGRAELRKLLEAELARKAAE